MIGAAIRGTGVARPARTISSRTLLAEAMPNRDADALIRRIGIETRGWIGEGESASTLGVRAAREALGAARIDPGDIRRVIFVSSTGGEHLIPATANDIAAELGMSEACDAFDINNACVGFLTALDIAARSVATGLGPVLIVVGEVFSRYLRPSAPRPYVVMADAGAAAVVARAETGGLESVWLGNRADLRGQVVLAHPGVSGAESIFDFEAPGGEIARAAVDSVREAVAHCVADARLELSDFRWFLPHQPNGELFEELASSLGFRADQVVPVVRDIGSCGAASLPWSLDCLRRSGRLAPGDRVLFASVGAGTACGAMVYRESW